MEYCGGGSCADLLEVLGPLPEPFIASICQETLTGLRYLHKSHKLHRDVKGAQPAPIAWHPADPSHRFII